MSSKLTPSQTVGPFFSIGFEWLNRTDLSPGSDRVNRITIRGRIFDGENKPVPDAVLEIWQADPQGNFQELADLDPSSVTSRFFGFGRVPVNYQGEFSFVTVKPGSTESPDARQQAPHLAVSIFMRGLLQRLVTRLYFSGEPLNDTDPVLSLVPAARRSTLLARPSQSVPNTLEWNICLQGAQETVFFEC
jgi:protocatechuate 3,4-dioxygenase, alpha subunit